MHEHWRSSASLKEKTCRLNLSIADTRKRLPENSTVIQPRIPMRQIVGERWEGRTAGSDRFPSRSPAESAEQWRWEEIDGRHSLLFWSDDLCGGNEQRTTSIDLRRRQSSWRKANALRAVKWKGKCTDSMELVSLSRRRKSFPSADSYRLSSKCLARANFSPNAFPVEPRTNLRSTQCFSRHLTRFLGGLIIWGKGVHWKLNLTDLDGIGERRIDPTKIVIGIKDLLRSPFTFCDEPWPSSISLVDASSCQSSSLSIREDVDQCSARRAVSDVHQEETRHDVTNIIIQLDDLIRHWHWHDVSNNWMFTVPSMINSSISSSFWSLPTSPHPQDSVEFVRKRGTVNVFVLMWHRWMVSSSPKKRSSIFSSLQSQSSLQSPLANEDPFEHIHSSLEDHSQTKECRIDSLFLWTRFLQSLTFKFGRVHSRTSADLLDVVPSILVDTTPDSVARLLDLSFLSQFPPRWSNQPSTAVHSHRSSSRPAAPVNWKDSLWRHLIKDQVILRSPRTSSNNWISAEEQRKRLTIFLRRSNLSVKHQRRRAVRVTCIRFDWGICRQRSDAVHSASFRSIADETRLGFPSDHSVVAYRTRTSISWTTRWLAFWENVLEEKDKQHDEVFQSNFLEDSVDLLAYLNDILVALKHLSATKINSSRCHSGKMIEPVGIAQISVNVCHKDHEISDAKFDSFFCECGAKEDEINRPTQRFFEYLQSSLGDGYEEIFNRENRVDLIETFVRCNEQVKKIWSSAKRKTDRRWSTSLFSILFSSSSHSVMNTNVSNGNAAKKKFTWNELNTLNVPFNVLSLQVNRLNSSSVSLTGLKDCQVWNIDSHGRLKEPTINRSMTSSDLNASPQDIRRNSCCSPLIRSRSSMSLSISFFILPTGNVRDWTFDSQSNLTSR